LDFYSASILKLPSELPEIVKEISAPVKKEIEKQVFAPPPLKALKEVAESSLTSAGVIQWTNVQREENGLPALKENAELNEAANAKLRDMFQNQYFAHYSPSGDGVADLAENANYKFLAIGENLALGNFENDKILVQAWMDSPGHRANILNSKYQEIGVAVGKGVYEGKTTWLAVQHFGLPFSACPQPSLSFKATINENQTRILELQSELLSLKDEIFKISPKRRIEYIQAIEQYNALVSQYNAFVEANKALINTYNSQVDLFNKCVAEFAG
jgi:uncharacterized protein YkwD